MQELEHLEHKRALELVEREDLGRRRYLKKYFDQDIDNPLLYHVVINTDLVPYEDAVRLIVDAVTAKADVEA
jgi:cytidylate kinase